MTVDEFMGSREVAECLGISRQRVHQLLTHADFPRPIASLAAGPVWVAAEILAWKALERPSGRPPTSDVREQPPQELIKTPPPHTLRAGAQVAGHDCRLVRTSRGWGVRCSCDWSDAAATEGDALIGGAQHTRNAWPILVERREDEAGIDWARRVQQEWLAAEDEREAVWEKLGMGHPIEPGQEIPVLSPEYIAADDRSEVLAHNMERAHAAMRADNGGADSSI